MSEEWTPTGLDVTTPNVARMYDYWLGGKDHYAADREAADRVMAIAPEAPLMARENRGFIQRAVRHLVGEAGIRQIIDIGAGLPTQCNVHEVAAEEAPGTRVLYVDRDPLVVAHARALLDTSAVQILQADARDVGELLEQPELRGFIDPAEPVAILMTAIFHFITDAEKPHEILSRLRDFMAPGSYLGLSHSTLESGPEAAAKIAKIYQSASAPAVLRSRAEIARLFDGFELIEPGLVYTAQWRQAPERVIEHPEKAWMLAGLGLLSA